MPQNKYASSVEILEHSARMGERWNLYEKTFFQTETKEVRWDDALKRWRCTTDRGDVFIAQ
jgi:cyclohexanone monooxygenase